MWLFFGFFIKGGHNKKESTGEDSSVVVINQAMLCANTAPIVGRLARRRPTAACRSKRTRPYTVLAQHICGYYRLRLPHTELGIAGRDIHVLQQSLDGSLAQHLRSLVNHIYDPTIVLRLSCVYYGTRIAAYLLTVSFGAHNERAKKGPWQG
jgi:hypothetical protein